MAWYKNTFGWSAVLSAIAIVLSQSPPVKDWFPNDSLIIKYGDRIGINNAIGLTGYHVTMELENNGNTTLPIESVKLTVVDPNAITKIYTAETLSTPSSSGAVLNLPVASLALEPGQRWSGSVFFNKNISPNEEESFNSIRLLISQNIQEKIQSQTWDEYNPNSNMPADEDVFKQAVDFFNSKFDLEKGLHRASVEVKIRNKDSVIEPFEFTLFEYHFEMIKAQVSDYKYGFGIYLPHLPNKQFGVKLQPNKHVN